MNHSVKRDLAVFYDVSQRRKEEREESRVKPERNAGSKYISPTPRDEEEEEEEAPLRSGETLDCVLRSRGTTKSGTRDERKTRICNFYCLRSDRVVIFVLMEPETTNLLLISFTLMECHINLIP